jgi:tRNA dimethylallyltransferase
MQAIVEDILQSINIFHTAHPHGIVVLWWATATGKSSLSVDIARAMPCEIISSDSRQIFRYMDIWTDKVSAAVRAEVPHYQIDIVNPDAFYTAGQRKKDVCELIPQIQARSKIPLIVGWTGLYIDTLYKNYSVPEVESDFDLRAKRDKLEEEEPWTLWKKLHAIDTVEAAKHHPNSTRYIIRALEIYEKTGLTKTDAAKEQPVQRPMLMIWLWREREDTNARIAKRVGEMLKWWLIEEVTSLLEKWYSPDLQSMQGIGYKETVEHLQSQWSSKPMPLSKLQELITIHTQQYAKRQRTWFRRYINDAENNPKENVEYKVYTMQ